MANIKDLEIQFTDEQITAFGGISLLYKMLDNCHFKDELSMVSLPKQGSNRGYSPIQLIYGLFTGVWCGASCFNHLDIVRYDPTICNLMGWHHAPDHRAYQRYFEKFSQATNQHVFGALNEWFFSNLCFDNFTLDFDSTVITRCGEQEGSAKGYNPKRPGRNSHHPLLAFVADLRMIANYWLRPGNTAALTNFISFLEDTLSRLKGKKVGLIRADSGFFGGEIFDYLENYNDGKGLNYIVACRFNNKIKMKLVSQGKWVEVAKGICIAETTYQADDWEKSRRIVMVRQDPEVRPKAAGKKVSNIRSKSPEQLELFLEMAELGKYRYSCFITNMTLPAKAIYDMYRGRADSENRIKEVKYDFSVDKYVSHDFWATEACNSFIILAYNFLSLFRHAIINSKQNYFLKTIRYKIINIPGYLVKSNNKNILRLARTIRQRQAFLGLWSTTEKYSWPKLTGS